MSQQLHRYSLALYKRLLKKSQEFHVRNEPGPNRSYRVSYLIPGNNFHEYLSVEIKKHFRQAQRLFKEQKKTSEWFEQQFQDGCLIYKGLERAMEDGYNQTHNKRKAIRLSPFIHILKAASGEHGNHHYHQKLKEIFILATLMTYQKASEPITQQDLQKNNTTIEKQHSK
ncbi:predicted protein [Naegleria gruberi]|uniref:Predicted protein n=1 Tax=Naegleria gruberi TaxID=5762 RepID=D2VID2_NAEGR|nr:uncharacterized protein NAEGRDRAFT_68645 [Naegleria gruberi]EFC43490.1 predicted protein [Naegleria gruberi]|eukprot:XP_002676234.1 predicted protein [Naegleria gruberi strain NEG-M]